MISLAVAAAGWVGVSSPGDYAAVQFPPLPRHDPSNVLQQQFASLPLEKPAIQPVLTECIVLRGEADGKPIEYEDTNETNQMREVLTAYNGLLALTFIDIPALEVPWLVRQDSVGREIRIGVGPRYQLVRRIFSRGSWEMNGRFYGPWWQGLNSSLRSQIFSNHPVGAACQIAA